MKKDKNKKVDKKEEKDFVSALIEEEIYEEYDKESAKKQFKSFKKILIPVIVVSAVAVAAAIVVPLALMPPKDPSDSLPSEIITDPDIIGDALTQNKVDKLAFEVTTAFQAGIEFKPSSVTLVNKQFTSNEKSQLEETLPFVDLILTNKSTFSTTIVESTKEDYNFELQVNYKDTSGSNFSHQIFFNVLKDVTEVENVETERTVYYRGVTTLYESGVEFIAKLEEETEGKELESEISLILYLNSSRTSYIEVIQSKEYNQYSIEEEFEYRVFDKGVLEKDFTLETEVNNNVSSVKLEVNEVEYLVETSTQDDFTLFKFSKIDKPSEVITFKKVLTHNEETNTTEVSYQEIN